MNILEYGSLSDCYIKLYKNYIAFSYFKNETTKKNWIFESLLWIN